MCLADSEYDLGRSYQLAPHAVSAACDMCYLSPPWQPACKDWLFMTGHGNNCFVTVGGKGGLLPPERCGILRLWWAWEELQCGRSVGEPPGTASGGA